MRSAGSTCPATWKKTQNDSVFGFDDCSIAVARDGSVFYQTYGQLWKVSP
jgi:hypothetical protein